MGDVALKVVEASNYTNAGTIEFLLDKDKNFYFLEVNARVQVEHPITELVTGVDIVKEQIRIAAGEELTLRQKNLEQRGHAIECRIYAEDPENNFLPSFGKIHFVKEPQGPGIRCDSGIYSGLDVTMHYDPLLSKLIVYAENREHARTRMIHALNDYAVIGIKTQIPFLRDVMKHPQFVKGKTTTDFIPKYMGDWKIEAAKKQFTEQALIAAALRSFSKTAARGVVGKEKTPTPWLTIGNWEICSYTK